MQRRSKNEPGQKCLPKGAKRLDCADSSALLGHARRAALKTPQSKRFACAAMLLEIIASLRLCTAIPRNHRAPRGFFWSADSLVRVFLPQHWQLADKAVRAPLVAAPPRYAFALKMN
jgi:hypothetical protein